MCWTLIDEVLLTWSWSISARWLDDRRAEEADTELRLGRALQQQSLAVLHDVGTNLQKNCPIQIQTV